jgi:hypothetical protein
MTRKIKPLLHQGFGQIKPTPESSARPPRDAHTRWRFLADTFVQAITPGVIDNQERLIGE